MFLITDGSGLYADGIEQSRIMSLQQQVDFVQRDYMTNTTLRSRFGIEGKNSATASRMIKEAMQAEMIRPFDTSASRKFMKYVPWWA